VGVVLAILTGPIYGIGILLCFAFVSLNSWLVITVFSPSPQNEPKRTRALIYLCLGVVMVAIFILYPAVHQAEPLNGTSRAHNKPLDGRRGPE
jgi:predicted membrane channel-forming protein YqfA (hemolysin III family)